MKLYSLVLAATEVGSHGGIECGRERQESGSGAYPPLPTPTTTSKPMKLYSLMLAATGGGSALIAWG